MDAASTHTHPPTAGAVGDVVAPLLAVREVSKEIEQDNGFKHRILSNTSMTVRRGEFICLLGPSGCGKTTLLNLCAGFELPSSGEILFEGSPVRGPSRERVVVFQDANAALFPWLTVEGNVTYASRLRRRNNREKQDNTDRLRLEETLGLVGLLDHRTKFPHEMSGGQRQRAQIARALASDPEVLLMDEPFGALDALTRRNLQGEIIRIVSTAAKTVVFVTHDVLESVVMADRILIFSPGPGARIAHEIPNDLPRPREVQDPAVAKMVGEVERIIIDEL